MGCLLIFSAIIVSETKLSFLKNRDLESTKEMSVIKEDENETVTVKLVMGCLLIFSAIIVSETKLSFLKNRDLESTKEMSVIKEDENITLS